MWSGIGTGLAQGAGNALVENIADGLSAWNKQRRDARDEERLQQRMDAATRDPVAAFRAHFVRGVHTP